MKNSFIFSMGFIFLALSCSPAPKLAEVEPETEVKKEEIQHYTLSLAAAGDNLFHDSIIRSYFSNGRHDFSPVYSEIKSIVQNADVAFINQETVMAGTSFGYSGYPRFNTPQSLGQTLADSGFDIINLANNHAMDMGRNGLYNTLDFLDTIEGLTVIGARKEGESARIITKNNITLGFLSYTFSLNGIPLPGDNPNLVSMINRDKMAEEAAALRPLCDFLIVSMHWGEEYRLEPGREQAELAVFLARHNVDLIIGHHPHVLQRTGTIIQRDGRKTLCFYSLGNFVSTQRERERIIGGIMVITFTKETSGQEIRNLSMSELGMIPVVTHYDRYFNNTKIYPLLIYSQEKLREHGLRIHNDPNLSMNFFYSVLNRVNARIILDNPFVN